MAGDQSFDVVSDFDEQELRNALDQVRREVGTRFDFKGVTVELTQTKDELILRDRRRVPGRRPSRTSIESKAIRRSLSLKIFDWGKVEEAGGNKVRQRIGAPSRAATRARQAHHEADPRRVPEGASPQIQGDAVRVSGKSRDELQRVIAPTARARRAGAAPVRELPLTAAPRGVASRGTPRHERARRHHHA